MIPACFVFLDQEKASGPVVRVERDGFSPVFALAHAREIAWVPNRFEADEFAAAFVVASRSVPGTVRLLGNGLWGQLVPRDTRRVYVVQ
ncbi:hypothetical protein [Caulobacter vibrioides]|uniref:Uncharacterized protein n=1 Tax=Caulobacter phage S2B TaxID=2759120 RepID=A0AAE7ML66_9CAUD|nr:hypothetical protein [Caulobacter vibrioides]QOC54173.1 hypothetical protein [Caulobacter phage S2B]QXZ50211.1 hypothetical protein KZH45_09770 [Caulobacter vibrioides]